MLNAEMEDEIECVCVCLRGWRTRLALIPLMSWTQYHQETPSSSIASSNLRDAASTCMLLISSLSHRSLFF